MKALRLVALVMLLSGFVVSNAFAGDYFEVDCQAMSSWYQCRDIKTAPKIVQDGYNIVMNTNTTIGPDGVYKDPDGKPYVFTPLACTSCHFAGGLIPEAIPFFQVRDKYQAPGLYYRAADTMRDVPSRINWCLVECANGQFLPVDSYPMQAMVAYMEWIAEGITDPNMIGKDNWHNIPGHTWPSFKQNVMTMQADPVRGEQIYFETCNTCHGKDGPGQGEYRKGEGRARVPALWGSRSYTAGAGALYSVVNISMGINRWMPADKPGTLSEQDALDVAGYINSQDRDYGVPTPMYYGANDPKTGIPNYYFKPSHFPSGVVAPNDPFTFEQHLLGPWAPIETWMAGQRTAWLAAHPVVK